jgi:hypothetical protein
VRPRRSRSVDKILAAAALAAAGFLAGCAAQPKAGLICPPVSLLSEANRATVYRPGPGRDLSDIEYEIQLAGFEGNCEYLAANKEDEKISKYREVNVYVRPRFRVTPGPALAGFRIPVNYFVAMPDFYPSPAGRADFSRTVDIPPSRTPVEFSDSEVAVNLPLDGNRVGGRTNVYLGLVLTEEQFRDNRGRTAGRLAR